MCNFIITTDDEENEITKRVSLEKIREKTSLDTEQ